LGDGGPVARVDREQPAVAALPANGNRRDETTVVVPPALAILLISAHSAVEFYQADPESPKYFTA
jgi:hypothetical protein